MGKRIRIIPVLMLLMLALAGCGRQGKVSERKYTAALEAFEEYYKDELQDEYEMVRARIWQDAEGMPLMYVMTADEMGDYYTDFDCTVFSCVKGKVTSIMEFSGAPLHIDGGIGVQLYTDGIISVAEYSERSEADGRGGYVDYQDTEQTWYQIRGDKSMEIARRDMVDCMSVNQISEPVQSEDEEDIEENREEIRFILGKKEYAVDLFRDEAKKLDQIFKKVCSKLYSKNARGSKCCQLWWRKELLLNEESPYLFMQSLPLSHNMCNDAKSFRRQISNLKKEGSKSIDEFWVWNSNEYAKESDGEISDAYYLMYRDPLLINETDLIKKWNEEQSYHQTVLEQLITYVMETGDYRVIEKLDFIDTISLKTMKKQTGQHLQYYLSLEDENDAYALQRGYSRDNGDTPAGEWFDKAVGDLLEENLKEEESTGYLKAYIKYLTKKKESIRDEFDTQEMALSAYKHMAKKDSELKGASFLLAQLGEEDELCLLTDRGFLTYDRGRISTHYQYSSWVYYWNEQTKELLIIMPGEHQSGPWHEDENGFFFYEEYEWEVLTNWCYLFVTVEDGKLTHVCDYYLDYETEEAYVRDWQEIENPEYEEKDWEECLDSLWQRRCGSAYEESGMEKEELDWATPRFSANLDTDSGKKMQRTVLLYPSVDKACEEFLKNGKASIEVKEPVEKQEKKGKDADEKDSVEYENDKNTSDEEPVAEEPVKDIYAPVQTTPSADYEEELPPEAASDLPVIDVETEVAQIRSWFTETQSHVSEYAVERPETGVERYDSGDGFVKIVLAKGFGGFSYERDYYFHDGEFYFAFVFNGGEEHRLYFAYGELIRYIDENKNTYDYGQTEAFDDWKEWVVAEAEACY